MTAASNAYFTANPTFGFSDLTSLASIQLPAQFLISADTLRGDKKLSRGSMTPQYLDSTSNAVPYPGSGFTANNGQAAIVARHRDGLNALYSDGHVKYKKGLQLWRSFTDNDYRTDAVGS